MHPCMFSCVSWRPIGNRLSCCLGSLQSLKRQRRCYAMPLRRRKTVIQLITDAKNVTFAVMQVVQLLFASRAASKRLYERQQYLASGSQQEARTRNRIIKARLCKHQAASHRIQIVQHYAVPNIVIQWFFLSESLFIHIRMNELAASLAQIWDL
ncbi:hypothetical protein GGI35DRAFT_6905 [Trichoderma velutinum]